MHQCQCGVLIVKLRLQLKLQPWLGFAADLGNILGSALSSHSAHCVAASGICSAFINSRTSTTNAQTVKGLWGDTNLVLWGKLKTYFEQLNILGPKFLLNFWWLKTIWKQTGTLFDDSNFCITRARQSILGSKVSDSDFWEPGESSERRFKTERWRLRALDKLEPQRDKAFLGSCQSK